MQELTQLDLQQISDKLVSTKLLDGEYLANNTSNNQAQQEPTQIKEYTSMEELLPITKI